MTHPSTLVRRLALIGGTALWLGACKGGEDPQVPTTLAPSGSIAITGTVSQAVSLPPSVTLKDQKGRGINNVVVHWTVTAGGGHVVSDSSRTDGAGTASSGGWTLGTTSGTQTLSATASGLSPTVFSAIAAPGPLASFIKLSGDNQQGTVNQTVIAPPTVRAVDTFGNPVSGVAVTFVAIGGGTITGGQKTTGADGVAATDSWKLGTTAGLQLARAQTATLNPLVEFTAIAQPGAATTIAALSTEAPAGATTVQMTGIASLVTCQQPSVKLVDNFGNPVAGGTVTFTPGANSGTVGRVTSQANAAGIASVLWWKLGLAAQQTLVATSASLPGTSITFVATLVTSPPAYTLCARFIGEGGTPRQREAVTKAVARWQRVITGHVATSHLTVNPSLSCADGLPLIDEDISDLVIYVKIADIDGPGNILGQASPCFWHPDVFLSSMGFFELDQADLTLLLAQGLLDNVVLHEMGHIIGIGTLWRISPRSLLTGGGGPDPFFTGSAARQQFTAIGGASYPGNPVPVENTGGAGTRDGHWRRSVFGTELMQGFAASNMPMSKVTIGSLADLGYQVSLAEADNFSLIPSIMSDAPAFGREMINDIADAEIWTTDRFGRKKDLIKPRRNPFR